jgi:hypothetical protein
MTRRHRTITALIVLLGVLAAARAHAQDAAGTVASLQGRAEAQRARQTAWSALAAGASVFVGDRIRTAEASRVKLLMRDDSVLTLGPKSELVIDSQVVRQEGSKSQLEAIAGSVRAVVTERYGTKGSSFGMKTPTAVAGVRGTGFVALIDLDGKRTRVVGLYDTTFVRGLADASSRHEVAVGPMQITEVLAGGLPSKPQTLPRAEFDALVADTGATGPSGGTPPGTPPGEPGGPPAEGSGDPYDPATPGPPGGGSIQRPDGKIDQPIDQLRGPREPPPPPPNRR